jgi:hypothetical protein
MLCATSLIAITFGLSVAFADSDYVRLTDRHLAQLYGANNGLVGLEGPDCASLAAPAGAVTWDGCADQANTGKDCYKCNDDTEPANYHPVEAGGVGIVLWNVWSCQGDKLQGKCLRPLCNGMTKVGTCSDSYDHYVLQTD